MILKNKTRHLITCGIIFVFTFFTFTNCAKFESTQTSLSSESAVVSNQKEELDYFSAHYLPVTQKANIQSALDTYGSVRLGNGDYSGVDIVMHSHQKLYGFPSFGSRVSNITITAGSTGVVLTDLFPVDKTITLQSGGVISGSTFKSIKWATLKGTNVKFENNTLINYAGNIQIDCSTSGYLRNNKIIRHQTGGTNALVLKGNATTPSYGNVHLWSNYLTPHGDTTELNGLQSSTFVGLDAESWNYYGEGTKAMLYAQNMGHLKIADLNGGNGGSPYKTPALDIDASTLYLLNRGLADPTDILSLRTNMFLISGLGTYTRKSGTVTGFDLQGNLQYSNTIKYNGVEQTAPLSNSTIINNLTSTILGTQYTPWSRQTWETLPDPLGPNWKSERIGKPDSTSYIQGLIDTQRIAELPEGIFYISSTLKIPTDSYHGIVGQGSGKTVIVGMTDDFPILSLMGGQDGSIVLAYLTIQGGSVGYYVSMDYGNLNVAYQLMKFVVFRNQNYGIHLNKSGGFDNNFLENVAFVNCNKGFFKEPTPGNSGEQNSAYVDKTVFYKNQFINCNTAVSMLATRADNLNAWIDSKFDGGKTAFELAGNNAPIIANSDITNYTGNNVISSNSISMYNTNVYGNRVTGSTLLTTNANIEGCNFLDSSPLFDKMLYSELDHHISNSTITGNVVVTIPSNQGYYPQSAVFTNSKLLSNPTLSKSLVNIKAGGTPTVIINTPSNPYPQFLVTQ